MLKALLVCLIAVCAAVAARAGEPSAAERLARDYLAAYSAVDTVAMARFLSPEAIFADQTARPEDGGPIVLNGRDIFLKQFVSYGLSRLEYELADVFESNGRVVFIGHVNAFYPRDAGGALRFRSRIVTVITVEGGKVARHEDFADYANAEKTVLK
ncbi:MAG: nuclear transport factor 2 family protein [Alphaproteobacteria bacterium]|nr:nuclear transport factor 2 family protein [Alphaproteobacteria bacterium]